MWGKQVRAQLSNVQMLGEVVQGWCAGFSISHQRADILKIRLIAETVATIPDMATVFVSGGLAALPGVVRKCPHTGEILLESLVKVAVRDPAYVDTFLQCGVRVWPELTRAHAPTSRLLGETLLCLAGESPERIAAVMQGGLAAAILFDAAGAKECVTLVDGLTRAAGAAEGLNVPDVGTVWREVILTDRSPLTNLPTVVVLDSTNRENSGATVLEGGWFRGPLGKFERQVRQGSHLIYGAHAQGIIRAAYNALACPEAVPSLFPCPAPTRQNRNGMERVTL